jgi:hypothetical protein
VNAARRNHIARLICSDLDGMPDAPHITVLYFVISTYKGARYVLERDVTRMTREATINDLRSGELSDVVSIIETEFTDTGLSSRDVTASMLMEADLLRGMAPDPIDRQAAAFDRNRDHAKNWRA